MLLYILVPVAVVVLDQLVKAWAATVLKAAGTIPLIQGVFHLTYAENTGAAFSFFEGGRTFFLIITPLALGAILWLLKVNYFPTRLSRLAAVLVLGGAVGNFIDRARQDFVVDMFDFRAINFPVFNVADMALTAGVALLIIYIFTHKEPSEPASRGKREEQDGQPPADSP